MNSFDSLYKGTPSWDIGKPQNFIKNFIKDPKLRLQDPILDIGCGTGENALYLASLGFQVFGFDASPRAIEKARNKATERKLRIHFEVSNALNLKEMNKKFGTIIDSGLFHIFSDKDRKLYAKNLLEALQIGGVYYMICFSNKEPGTWGPRRITQNEIQNTFKDGWKILFIKEAEFDTNLDFGTVAAWFTAIKRV